MNLCFASTAAGLVRNFLPRFAGEAESVKTLYDHLLVPTYATGNRFPFDGLSELTRI